jgi:hypothetical protein
LEPDEKITVPGYSSLNAFSQAHEQTLKAQCGGSWQSYLQRGNWRMIWCFSRKHQEKTARQLVNSIREDRPPIVHVAHFPKLQINHALLLFEAKETEDAIEFTAYDPNYADKTTQLFFRKEERRFYYPPQTYFPGGRVDVYEIFYRWNY